MDKNYKEKNLAKQIINKNNQIKRKKYFLIFLIFLLVSGISLFLIIDHKLTILFYSIFTLYTLITYLMIWFEEEKSINLPKIKKWPNVSIIIPCYNSSDTVLKTIEACKALEYRAKKEIIVVDDGSTDNVFEKLKKIDNIKAFRKEKNSGKGAALNYGIEKSSKDSEIIICVDADSYPQEDTLLKAVPYFYLEEKVGAVVLYISAYKPKTLAQRMQQIEYWISMGFMLRIVSLIDSIYVTPGPMALYKKEVFNKIGFFDENNLTEDMEIALRMQRHGWKIKACHDSVVYTETPKTFFSLFKQRIRWFRGGINNVLNYADMVFNIKYGALGFFIMPLILITGFCGSILVIWALINYSKAWQSWLFGILFAPKSFEGFIKIITQTLYLYDSSMIFWIVALFFWMYFIYQGFKLAKQKIKAEHIIPILLILWFYPVFIGLAFFSAAFFEAIKGERKW